MRAVDQCGSRHSRRMTSITSSDVSSNGASWSSGAISWSFTTGAARSTTSDQPSPPQSRHLTASQLTEIFFIPVERNFHNQLRKAFPNVHIKDSRQNWIPNIVKQRTANEPTLGKILQEFHFQLLVSYVGPTQNWSDRSVCPMVRTVD